MGKVIRYFLTVSFFAILPILCAADGSSTVDADGNVKLENEQKARHVMVQGRYNVLDILPHDKKAFTQGVTYFDGHLYEGTGLYGQSTLRRLDPSTMRVLQSYSNPAEYFGEGITYYKDGKGNDRILQLTWKEKTAFVFDPKTLEVIYTFKYHMESGNGEGWGLTFDEENNEFIMSDGSQYLHFWDAARLEECELYAASFDRGEQAQASDDAKFCDKIIMESSRQVKVHAYRSSHESEATPLNYLNELEMIPCTMDGHSSRSVLANVFTQTFIVEIDPASGLILKVYDLSDLAPDEYSMNDVLNGISVGESDRVLFVTGKNWPKMYKIRLL